MSRAKTPRQQQLVLRFVHYEEIQNGTRYVVGSGDKRAGLRGRAIAVIGLKHAPGYEVVLQLDNGRHDSFAPGQLSPAMDEIRPAANSTH